MSTLVKLSAAGRGWVEQERRTGRLVRACYRWLTRNRRIGHRTLHGLAQLTWITVTPGKGKEAPEYWRRTTIPGLQAVFSLKGTYENLDSVAKDLPASIGVLAAKWTGFTNFYTAYRGSCASYLRAHWSKVRKICMLAASMSTDEHRKSVARLIDSCPPGKRNMHPNSLLGPLVACLDPASRFPMVNNAPHVRKVLRDLGVSARDTVTRLEAMMRWINQAGIPDAFYLDTAAMEEVLDPIVIHGRRQRGPAGRRNGTSGRPATPGGGLPPLGWEDDETIEFVRKMKKVRIANVHKKMTNALSRLLQGKMDVRRGRHGPGQFDVLVKNYQGNGRDLLIEVKPLADLMAARLAVGQLLDYRRYVHEPTNTDLAVLFPTRPGNRIMRFLSYVAVVPLWFRGFGHRRIVGGWNYPDDG